MEFGWCALTAAEAAKYTLPNDVLPLAAMKEDLSYAYLRMLASSVGFTVGDWSQDYDCRDVTVSSGADYASIGGTIGPQIDVQLKSTGQSGKVTATHVQWDLDVRCYKRLSAPNRSTPALLCVLLSPEEPQDWLELDRSRLIAKSTMFWVWGHELPALGDNKSTKRVSIPLENQLTSERLLTLMEVASRWPH